MAPPLIELRRLTKVYQEGERSHTVLREVNLTIQAGEFVVLLGRSGSGKSTLLNLISGIDMPTAGEVVVYPGLDESGPLSLARLSEQQRTLFRRRHIGFVFQFFNLLPTLSIQENILLPLELNGWDAERAEQASLAMLDRVGLADRAGDFADRLSGGEQQRVAIARALVHEPLLILADEPTGNLDIETGRTVLGLLDRLTRQAGKTLLMVTHSQEVIGMADRIFSIQDGHLLERLAGKSP
ncbi:MAG: ABC transporter ATP-binding protein [Desulfurellaceae bacterium]|nr:ABC transporter ATP-binding protein [Desulfurellaceae bacterium]